MRKLIDALDAFNIVLCNPNNEEANSIISQEYLIKKLWEFLCADKDKNIIFNPGSAFSSPNPNKIKEILYFGEDIYLTVLIIYSTLDAIYKSIGNTDNFIKNLPIDTILIYNDDPKERYYFKGVKERNGFLGIDINNINGNGYRFVPQKDWNLIIKDNGNCTINKRGRTGIKDYRIINDFLKDSLCFNDSQISVDSNFSTIIVIDEKAKERARNIIKNVKLKYGDNKSINLSDIVNAAFYSISTTPKYYSGNVNKQEPTIKITSNLNTALELCSKRYREKEIDRIIISDSIIEKTKSSSILNILLNQKRVTIETDYSFISRLNDVLDSELYKNKLIKSYIPDGALLLTNELNIKYPSLVNEVLKWQADDIKNKKTDAIFFNSDFTESDYIELKSLLFSIKRTDVLSDNKDLFFIKAYYILKTLSASIISINDLKEDVDLFAVFDELRNTQLPNYGNLNDSKLRCEELILKLIETRKDDKKRQEKLLDLLYEENQKGKKLNSKRTILIVVHKKFLQLSIERLLSKFQLNNIDVAVETHGKIKNKKFYDLIICAGLIPVDSFNFFDINFTERVIFLCARYKEKEYIATKDKNEKNKRKWFRTSFFDLKIKDELLNENELNMPSQQDFTDFDFEELIKDIVSNGSYMNQYSYNRHDITVNTLALFDDDSCGFFTPSYKVNVLRQNEETKEYEVIALPIEKVVEGDDIIFVERQGKMRDAIKEIQNFLVEKEALPKVEIDAINITQKWRDDLACYVKNKNKKETKKSIAERCNVSVIEFNNWLNFDFYIVGPDPKSITGIGKVINYDLMINEPNTFKAQVDIVNRLHTKIRRALGEAIIAKEEGKTPTGVYAIKIFDQIGNLENIRRVQEIKKINKKVDVTLTNYPISY